MLNGYKILTSTYKEATLKELASFAVLHEEDNDLQERLEFLKESFGIEELMYISTCNRVTYFIHTSQTIDYAFALAFFRAANPEIPLTLLDHESPKFSIYEGADALQHLFRVAASVDSMVVGEREILRQVRDAYAQSQTMKLCGDSIRLAMKFTVNAAKEVYATTKIGERPVSVVSLAIQKMLRANLPKTARILLIGAGQTNNLVTKFLHKHGYKDVNVFNRTIEKAKSLAQRFDGEGFDLQMLHTFDKGFDAIIVCTGANKAFVDNKLYQALLQKEEDKKMVIDLAVPNNVTRSVVSDFDVNYIEIEGLKNLAKENMSFRQNEVTLADKLISKRIQEFHTHYQHRKIEKAMQHIPTEIKAIKSHAMQNVFKKEIDGLDEETKALIERMLTYMEKQCISIPMKAAKEQKI